MELIIAGLVVLIAVREYITFKERKDMLDRLMSRTFEEYKDNSKPEENHLEPEDDGTESLEAAKGKIMYGEEED